jgi:hypothetical protein
VEACSCLGTDVMTNNVHVPWSICLRMPSDHAYPALSKEYIVAREHAHVWICLGFEWPFVQFMLSLCYTPASSLLKQGDRHHFIRASGPQTIAATFNGRSATAATE